MGLTLPVLLFVPFFVAADEQALPSSPFASPLYLEEEPPELRTLGLIWMPHVGVEGVYPPVESEPEEVLEEARGLVQDLRGGADWYAVAAERSALGNGDKGSILGSFAQGMLSGDLDAFLFSAEIGETGDPIVTERGVFVPRRFETWAGCRLIKIRGTEEEAWELARSIAKRARDGESFAALALDHSAHPASAARGGAWSIFERGSRDSLIKLEVFKSRVGEVTGPIEASGSLYVVLRVPPEELDPELRENNWIRVRVLALAYDGAEPGLRPNPREVLDAMDLALDLRERILGGEDMGRLVKTFGDDLSSLSRGGDLGWIHRTAPKNSAPVQRMFQARKGALIEPLNGEIGIVLLRRER